ncbi:MAG: class I mannose-6-phosphate isomerase [Muribaculaceae bacterium]|nr:class I mannose-6-phosphate isomerase [Muribaculaceae bacterium]
MIEKAPIRFVPYLKSVIWGGNKICSYKGIGQPEPNIGESWEISAVPGHESVVAEGPYKGMTVTELIDRFGVSLLGERIMERYGGKFPLLVKLIDANDNLSVQVHPDDRLAKSRHDSLGKTEMWYIIDTEKDARIYSGFKAEITPDVYEKCIAQGSFEELLAVHRSAPGDVFFLPAGRVHAIGAGNLLAEIQESSDITYRIYDYNRKDADGNTRELHTELAKDAIDYKVHADYKSPRIPDDEIDAEIVGCDHFTVRRINVDGKVHLDFSPDSFTVIMCIHGDVILECPYGNTPISKGQTVLCPAILSELSITGKATLLTSQAT